MEEIKKEVLSTKGSKYLVSNFGYVETVAIIGVSKGIRHIKYKSVILKPSDNGKGYKYINLGGNYENRKYLHRLIAELFIPNPENKPEVNHIDGNKSNNHVDNLEWVTKKENSQHAINIGLIKLRGEKSSAKKLINEVGIVFDCIKDASDFYNINYGTLKDALSKKGIYKGLTYLLNKN